MGKIIDRCEPERTAYPWAEWADGRARRLTRGVDFSSTLDSFRCGAYAWAKRNGYKVTVHRHRDTEEIDLQFRSDEAAKGETAKKKSSAKRTEKRGQRGEANRRRARASGTSKGRSGRG